MAFTLWTKHRAVKGLQVQALGTLDSQIWGTMSHSWSQGRRRKPSNRAHWGWEPRSLEVFPTPSSVLPRSERVLSHLSSDSLLGSVPRMIAGNTPSTTIAAKRPHIVLVRTDRARATQSQAPPTTALQLPPRPIGCKKKRRRQCWAEAPGHTLFRHPA